MDDPAVWDTGRVVRELCSAQSILPKTVEQALHDNEITGNILVHQINDDTSRKMLFEALHLHKLAHKLFLHNLITNLQARSAESADHFHPSPKRQANFGLPDTKRAKTEMPILASRPADAANPPAGASKEPSSPQDQPQNDGDGEGSAVQMGLGPKDDNNGHQNALNNQFHSSPGSTTEVGSGSCKVEASQCPHPDRSAPGQSSATSSVARLTLL